MISYLPGETLGEIPLDKASWRMLLADLIDDVACSGSADEVARLREAYVLLARAPAAQAIAPLPPAAGFAGWLAAGACETAALALLGEGANYMISYGGERHFATLVLVRTGEEHSADGATLALALLGALGEALLADRPLAAASAAHRLLH